MKGTCSTIESCRQMYGFTESIISVNNSVFAIHQKWRNAVDIKLIPGVLLINSQLFNC